MHVFAGENAVEPTRRRFLALGGGVVASAALAACTGRSSRSTTASARVGPHDPAVAAAERARQVAGAATIDVKLTAAPAQIDLGGVTVFTWAYDGVVPGKEIRVTRGQRLRVDLGNHLPQPSTVHWHGLAIRNDMDGVPNLTQDAVAAGSAFRYDFTVPESGTFWFHPHVATQLDRGLYAPLIVENPSDGAGYDEELVVVLDDWLDGAGRTPDSVLADLRRNGMGGMGTMGAMSGSGPSMTPTTGGMTMPQSRVLGGDAGDVTYPYYLANGRIAAAPQVVPAKPRRRYRLRLINAGSDTAFRVGVPGQRLQITHTDGFPVIPISAQSVLVGMGERIDAVIEIPDSSVPLLIVPEGKPGHAQVGFRVGTSGLPDPAGLIPAFLSRPVLMSTDTRAAEQVLLGAHRPEVTHTLTLAGPTSTYAWTINGNIYDPARGVPVRQGQFVRLRFENRTTMFHPMHLHGHTFQARGADGAGPRKDTVLVLPGRTVEVDFVADNPGQWLTHCHNVYHGEAGMMTVVSYVQ
jgi:FtsP/CotA-like multicopper oxidase with cupredoxin domain